MYDCAVVLSYVFSRQEMLARPPLDPPPPPLLDYFLSYIRQQKGFARTRKSNKPRTKRLLTRETKLKYTKLVLLLAYMCLPRSSKQHTSKNTWRQREEREMCKRIMNAKVNNVHWMFSQYIKCVGGSWTPECPKGTYSILCLSHLHTFVFWLPPGLPPQS